ncbi:LuxR C-terminal-related transcriptional regulator [Marvinbryantia formatexigens DSM 14469]|uniref:LuxR C-terminal-related transcriptional regulator n=1 Tax=Marvinbryantia formatexigens TaxID=168384 RepID=UPI0002DBB8A1|nr:LuxR C-terminal-related transcriptional regulator [Marvinbryantia formatexigens]UWO24896.1 LuxR C-terminal-related transcriptional regulator [Marvinbryantia formatexigens DSM 14469]
MQDESRKRGKNTADNDVYIRPKAAERKLKAALELGMVAYLYGVTGTGKTRLAREVLARKQYEYYSARETQPEEVGVKPDGQERIVVVDDLYTVTLQEIKECWAALFRKLAGQEGVRLVLVSRAPVPGWLLPLQVEYRFAEIGEKDLCLTRRGQDAYLELSGIRLEPEAADRAWELGKGHPVSLKLLALENGDVDLAVKNMWLWLENHIFDQWEKELSEFLMETSIVENYTKELAAMITGRDDVDALEMYGEYGDAEDIRRVLSANARRNPAAGSYFELRGYYLSLPEEMILGDPVLMCYMSMLHSILMDTEESERWYRELEEYAKKHSGGERREARRRLFYLDIALPHRGSADIASLIKNAGSLLPGQRTALPEFSVTTNLPSLMNGGKDFCEWSRHDRELAASIGKAASIVLGKYGKGLVPLALAESGLEKGMDSFEVMRLAEKGRIAAEGGGKTELCFVAAALLAWVAVLNGNAEFAEDIMTAYRERAEKEAPRTLPNADAFLCRIYLYRRQPARAAEWMEKAPDENGTFCTLERFRYLTKARVCLMAGKTGEALALLEQLLYYAEKMKRTYIHMEASLLLAIALYRAGREEWRETLQGCVTQAESYHFVRLFSRECGTALDLLETADLTWQDGDFRTEVLDECRRMEKFYPRYMEQGTDAEVRLPEQALKVLRMQAEGLSTRAIAERMGVKENTVKYHNKETYRKLGVNTRTAAVNEARKRKLI